MTDYDKRRQEEQARNKEVEAKMAGALVILGYEIEAQDRQAWDSRAVGIKGNTKLWLSFSAGYGKNRINASGSYPRHTNGDYVGQVYYTNEEREAIENAGKTTEYGKVPSPSITISPDKSPAQIAKDLERRLIPDVDDYTARVIKVIEGQTDCEDKSLNALEVVAGRKLDEYDARNKKTNVHIERAGEGYACRVHITAHREDVRLEIADLKPEQARRVVELVQSMVK